MANPEYVPSEIEGVFVDPSEVNKFTAYSPFAWQGEAIAIAALVGAGESISPDLAERIEFLRYASEKVEGSALETLPLGPGQIAAATIAGAILNRLVHEGYIKPPYA